MPAELGSIAPRAGREWRLQTIQPPWREPTVNPETAREWLVGDFRSWFHAAAVGGLSDDEKTRDAASRISYDVTEIACACIDAVLGNKTVRLTLDGSAQSPLERLNYLARIVHYLNVYCADGTGGFADAFVDWSLQLRDGLGTIHKETGDGC